MGILTKFRESEQLPIALLLADDSLCPFRRQCLTKLGIGQPGRAGLDEHRCSFEVHDHLEQCPRYRRQETS
jgi:hypothetical protein